MVFLLSEYLDDKSADNFFDSKISYGYMLENHPNRYKNKREIVYNQIEQELKKWNAKVVGRLYDNDNCIVIEFIGGWKDRWMVSVDESDGDVMIEIGYNEGWKLKYIDEEEREFKYDDRIKNLFKTYFDCR